jgi:hypothetical protein
MKNIITKKLVCLMGFLLLGLGMSASLMAQEAGKIMRVTGKATVSSVSNQTKEATKDDVINTGDTITSSKESQVLIRMKDNSSLLVRADSKIKIAAFQFENKPTDNAKTTVIAGTLRAVSGSIGKGQPDNVKYEAGTATIGIRGTDIEVAIVEEGAKDRAGIYNYVYDGETVMALNTGEKANVEKELTGFTPAKLLPGEPRLQILRDRPAFLQIGGFDALINQLTAPRIPMMR